MIVRHLCRSIEKSKTIYGCRKLMSTYNPTDKKFPPDVMEKFLSRLSNYGNGEIILELDNATGIAVVTVENKKRKNALTGHMMVALKDVVSELESWKEGKAIILRGYGDTFCSGGDLNAVMKEIGTPDEGRMMCEYMQETLTRFMELPLISVAALNGKALGGGAEIGFVQSKLAISTGWGGGSRLVKIVGKRKALQLLTTAKILQYQEALNFGIADALLDKEKDPTECCADWLKNGGFLHAHPKVVQTMKQISVNADDMSLRDALDEERDLFAALWGGSMHKEALNRKIKHR